MLKQGKEIRASQQGKPSSLRKRFWKDVHVKQVPEGYQIMLDARPVRTLSKSILTVPVSKPCLAHAIALEWDLLVYAQQALKNHNIPLTSIASHAQDIIEQEAQGGTKIRSGIVRTLMRHLETDTLLCWVPEHNSHDAAQLEQSETRTESLRRIQMRTAKPITSFLAMNVWPGVEIKPILDEDSILPNQQSEVTKSIINGWMSGLPAFELAALEVAGLASKSLLIAARLVVEWSEQFRDVPKIDSERFDIDRAAEAASLEVSWQTGMWGEVEDTHDVEKEDLKRQLGSAILLLSGRE